MKIALLAFVALATLSTTSHADVSTTSIAADIARVGAAKVVAKLYESSNDWRDFMAGVATGEPQWLLVAVNLGAGVDGGAAEELLEAIGEGLEHRPSDVLALTIPTYRLEDICSGPDIDDSRFNSAKSALTAIGRRSSKIAAITEPALRKRADDCIQSLEESKRSIERFFQESPVTAPNKSLERTGGR